MQDDALPPLRADAKRNRAKILQAAQEAFALEGKLVPLDEIARRAGVGAGTVYRHFATKEVLFQQVVNERLEQIVDEARALATAAAPGTAFYDFFAHVVEQATFNHALCEALALQSDPLNTQHIEEAFNEALDDLLQRARAAGEVRRDIDIDDVRALLAGCLTMERRRALPGRMAALACEALRPVTKPLHRNETIRNTPTTCETCARPLEPSRTGRPARYCSAGCRQKAHRLRHR
ncbi:TetR family transcriptional regulator [Spirillospora sp. CA-294931]|uniref:SbtR family transcriptional regulator n=1 Tax=Spirillospora sp. CA-294931 TaxID=3240042 RepID=UPI003D89EB1D